MARTTRVRSSDAIHVEGLTELNRSLKAMDSNLPKQLRAANKDVATEVAHGAQSAAYALGGVAAKTAPSIKASAGVTSAGVALGGPDYPFAGGAEFGSARYPQFKPWRGNGSDAGYFVYPTIRDKVDDIQRTYEEAVDDLIKRVGLA